MQLLHVISLLAVIAAQPLEALVARDASASAQINPIDPISGRPLSFTVSKFETCDSALKYYLDSSLTLDQPGPQWDAHAIQVIAAPPGKTLLRLYHNDGTIFTDLPPDSQCRLIHQGIRFARLQWI